MRKMGEIITRNLVVEYEMQTRSVTEDRNGKTVKYRCHPRTIGECTPAQQAFVSAHDGELMAPAAMMKMFREA